MYKYNLKIAWRNILRYPGYSLTNIFGLSVGITVSFIIFVYLHFETSYDKFYPNYERISRVGIRYDIGGKIDYYSNIPRPIGPTMWADYPEIEAFTRMRGVGSLTTHRAFLNHNETFIESDQIFVVDSSFFKVFEVNFLAGNPKTALTNPNSIALARDLSVRLFGKTDVLGQTLRLENSENLFEVTAIFENLPQSTHMPYDALVSWNGYYPPGMNESWIGRHVYTYFLFDQENRESGLIDKFPSFYEKYMAETFNQFEGTADIIFQPLKDIHLTSNLTWEAYQNGNMTTIYLFSAVALFLLVIVVINYVNITTARSATRAKEIGVRKAIGAQKKSLVTQFLTESVLMALFSFTIACLISLLISPYSGNLLGIPLTELLLQTDAILLLLVLSLVVGLISGIYPALFISAYKSVEVLKGKFTQSNRGTGLRKALVIVQLSVSIFVIAGTLIVMDQVNYIRDKDLGFSKENVLVVHLKDTALQNRIIPIKNELSTIPTILGSASAFNLPDRELNHTVASVENADGGYDDLATQFMEIDPDLIELLGMKVIEGRKLKPNSEADLTGSLMINQSAASKFAWNPNPLGKRLHFGPNEDGNIDFINNVGVIQDFHMGSLQFRIEPVIIFAVDLNERGGEWLFVKMSSDQLSATLESIRGVLNRYDPAIPIEFKFLDENFDLLYQKEQKLIEMLGYFSIIVIAISCLGLLGLISFIAAQRSKEIAVRKVLGAGLGHLVILISRSFILMALVANVIAWPFAYWVMDLWLQNFAYRIDIGIEQFLLATVLSLVLIFLTITNHALKTAKTEPAVTLKEE